MQHILRTFNLKLYAILQVIGTSTNDRNKNNGQQIQCIYIYPIVYVEVCLIKALESTISSFKNSLDCKLEF